MQVEVSTGDIVISSFEITNKLRFVLFFSFMHICLYSQHVPLAISLWPWYLHPHSLWIEKIVAFDSLLDQSTKEIKFELTHALLGLFSFGSRHWILISKQSKQAAYRLLSRLFQLILSSFYTSYFVINHRYHLHPSRRKRLTIELVCAYRKIIES